MTTLEMLRP